MKHFTTFKELDSEIRIHALSRDIAREQLELKWNRVQQNLKPANMALQFGRNLQRSIIYILATAIIRKISAAKKSD